MAYSNRALNCSKLYAPPQNIDLAIKNYLIVLKHDPDSATAVIGLLKSYHFKAIYTTNLSDSQQKEILIKGKELGKKYIQLYPENTDIIYWTAVNLGKWAELSGSAAAIKENIPQQLKKLCEKVISLDPEYDKGLAYLFYGRLNHLTPYVPLLITWPSKKNAEQYYKKAIELDNKNLSAKYFMAELYHSQNKNIESKKILLEVINQKPREEYILADRCEIEKTKLLLSKIEKN